MKFIFAIIALLALLGFAFYLQETQTPKQMLGMSNQMIQSYQQWKSLHNKIYSSEGEEWYRMQVYGSNKQYIKEQNDMNLGYTLAENKFMDITQEEFVKTYLGLIVPEEQKLVYVDDSYNAVNGSVNWVTAGAVTPVKDQGQCGSCWAFSSTGVCEGADFIYKGTLGSFSEQQLVDCSGSYGNQGCNGGWPIDALSYVAAQGIETEVQYPYQGVDEECEYNASLATFKVNTPTQASGCSGLISYINQQPTSVCVDATNWQFYQSGIFSNCGTSIDHAVLAVGYDTSGNWIIKNSWGTSWGMQGYITLKNGNTCAVCQYPVVATA